MSGKAQDLAEGLFIRVYESERMAGPKSNVGKNPLRAGGRVDGKERAQSGGGSGGPFRRHYSRKNTEET